MSDEKRCRKCNEWKPLTEFTERRDKPGAYSPACRACDGAKKSKQAERWSNTQRSSAVKAANKPKPKPDFSKKPKAPNAYELEFRKMRPAIEKRSKGQCEARTEVCAGAGVQVHHRKLRSQGGTNAEINLIHVCFPCHEWIHAHPKTSYERGWLIRSSDDETPYKR